MIDLSIYDDLVNQNKGILSDVISSPASSGNFKLERYNNPKRNGWVLYSAESTNYGKSYVYNAHDDINFIKSYFSEILNRDFSSILIGGLGLGMLPYVVKNYCSVVDVIELNYDIISLIEPIGYLSGVDIMCADVYGFVTDRKYDIIVLDIWLDDSSPNLDVEINTCIYQYVPFLNEGGIIYFPINRLRGQTIWDYDTDINNLYPPPIQPTEPIPTPPI